VADITVDSDKQRIAEAFHLGTLDDMPLEAAPSYNIAPSTMQPVIRQNRDRRTRDGGDAIGHGAALRQVACRVQRILHHQCKGRDLALAGNLAGSISPPAMPHPGGRFYEWKRLNEKTKQPYAFAMRSGEPFAFGGLWDGWKDPTTGDWLQSFSIITTDPNELTATVHNRMPVILKPSDYDRWLDRADAERPPVDLLRPYEAAEMTAHEVDPRVGNVRNDEPSLCNIWQCPPNSL